MLFDLLIKCKLRFHKSIKYETTIYSDLICWTLLANVLPLLPADINIRDLAVIVTHFLTICIRHIWWQSMRPWSHFAILTFSFLWIAFVSLIVVKVDLCFVCTRITLSKLVFYLILAAFPRPTHGRYDEQKLDHVNFHIIVYLSFQLNKY